MKSQQWLLPVNVLAIVLIAAGVAWWDLYLRPGVSEHKCNRIMPGMTLDEVNDILGGPPSYEEGSVDRDGRLEEYEGHWYSNGRRQVHEFGEYVATVTFDPDKRVCSVSMWMTDFGRTDWRWRYEP